MKTYTLVVVSDGEVEATKKGMGPLRVRFARLLFWLLNLVSDDKLETRVYPDDLRPIP